MDTYSFTPQSATGLLSRLRSFWAYAKLYLFRRRTIPLIIPVSSAVPRLERSKEPKGELNKNPPEISRISQRISRISSRIRPRTPLPGQPCRSSAGCRLGTRADEA